MWKYSSLKKLRPVLDSLRNSHYLNLGLSLNHPERKYEPLWQIQKEITYIEIDRKRKGRKGKRQVIIIDI